MLEQIQHRRSVRRYLSKPVGAEKLTQLFESARLAPSGNNTQPWVFVVVTDRHTKELLCAADHQQNWMLSAPVFIVCVADVRSRISQDTPVVVEENTPLPELKLIIRDTAIAIEHLLLEAENLNLASCWTAWFEQKDVRPVLGIPPDKYVCGIITLGYADETPKPRPRKPLEAIVRYEKWQ